MPCLVSGGNRTCLKVFFSQCICSSFLSSPFLFLGLKKLPDLGKALGESIREFKKAISGDEKDSPTPSGTTEKQDEMKKTEALPPK